MKCLIIDDDDFNRDFVSTVLGDLAECDEAANCAEAVARFTEALQSDAPYDLIFQDIMMPGTNGHETARIIRSIEKTEGIQAGKGVRIVMLTALNSPQDAMESFCAFQSAAYVVKPVSREKLLDVISKLGLLKN
jgi:two-component system chemotaxis response regulator CheY